MSGPYYYGGWDREAAWRRVRVALVAWFFVAALFLLVWSVIALTTGQDERRAEDERARERHRAAIQREFDR